MERIFDLSDLFPDVIKFTVSETKTMLLRCACKSLKSKVEDLPGVSLRLTFRGVRGVTEDFLACFTSICIVCPIVWNKESVWLTVLVSAMRKGLHVESMDVSIKSLDINDLLLILIDPSANLRLQHLTLRYEVRPLRLQLRRPSRLTIGSPPPPRQGGHAELESSAPRLAALARRCALELHIGLASRSPADATAALLALGACEAAPCVAFRTRWARGSRRRPRLVRPEPLPRVRSGSNRARARARVVAQPRRGGPRGTRGAAVSGRRSPADPPPRRRSDTANRAPIGHRIRRRS